jgi:uncharacterized protein YdaL
VLYDYRPNDQYGKLGKVYAIMLRNLIGHFTTDVTLADVSTYQAGQALGYDVVFYLGAYYDNPVPSSFLADIGQMSGTLVWIRNNIWQLAWDPAYQFTDWSGIIFGGLVGMNSAPSPTNPEPGFFDTVQYKGLAFPKFFDYDEATNTILADPLLGATFVADQVKAEIVVEVSNSVTGQVLPWAIRSDKFWYLADMPFSYIGPRDRYLVFSDLLHDIFGIDDTTPPRAMIRLEDVNALSTRWSLNTLSDYFDSAGVPFSIALIPIYLDPYGLYNNGAPVEIRLTDQHPDAATLRNSVSYAQTRGGSIVMHGVTHQYGALLNPYNGVSGNDFEFWDIVNNSALPGLETTAQVLDRLDTGLAELSGAGITPFAWEVPHYHASPVASQAFPQRFARTYQRAVYCTEDHPVFSAGDYCAGQFFPYEIQSDYYGQMIIPENLGNIEYDISDIDPTSNVTYTWQDLLKNAEYALVVRGVYGSFFFHPFWLEPDLGTPGLADLQCLINGMNALGYTWVSAEDIY